MMKGYLNNPEGNKEAFSDEGWFRSGDIGLFDEDGYLYIVDRLKYMIITDWKLIANDKEIERSIITDTP